MVIRFTPGSAWAAVAGSRVAVLPADTAPEQIDRTFAALSNGDPLRDIANAPERYGFPLALGDFGPEKQLARRSGVPARLDDSDLASRRQSEIEFETVRGQVLLLGDFEGADAPLLPIGCGVTRVRALRIELSDVSLETLLPEDVPEQLPESGAVLESAEPLAGGIIDSVPGFQSAPGASTPPPAAPRQPSPAVNSAPAQPSTPRPSAPQPAPPQPETPFGADIGEPTPAAPLTEQLGDHDGNTIRAEDAQELIARMRSGQSASSATSSATQNVTPGRQTATDGEPQVLSTSCLVGHVNPPSASACSVCGGDIAQGSLQRRPRPDVAALLMPSGERIPLRETVVFGRRPRSRSANARAKLVVVDSPEEDISRSHLEIRVEDWNVVAEDLGSTNGTMLLRPGQQPQRLRPETPAFVQPGDRLDIGEGVVIEVVAP